MKSPIDGVRDAIKQYMPSYDSEVPEIILATVVANQLKGPPVWLMLISPPSSGKTIALEPLDALPNTKLLSKLTEKTLLSGMPDQNGKPASLLLQLGPKPTLVVKDLGTMLEGTTTVKVSSTLSSEKSTTATSQRHMAMAALSNGRVRARRAKLP